MIERELNIYGQHIWHSSAFILGSRSGLLVLAFNALKAAIFRRSTALVFALDGEGYDLVFAVGKADDPPYLDEVAGGSVDGETALYRYEKRKKPT